MANKTIPALPPLSIQNSTDVYEMSDATGSAPSAKETRSQILSYIQTNIQITEDQVTDLVADLASKLALAGGTMTGPLILAADPTLPLGAATKQYVDGEIGNIDLNMAYANTAGQNFFITSGLNVIGNNFNLISGTDSKTTFDGTTVLFNNPIDEGVNNAWSTLQWNGTTIGTIDQFISTLKLGFNDETTAGQESSYFTYQILDDGNINSVLSILGTDTYFTGTRMVIGGTNSTTNHVDNVSIGLGISASPYPTALLQVDSTTQGVIFTTLTAAEQVTLLTLSPPIGLEWFNTTTGVKTYYNGTGPSGTIVDTGAYVNPSWIVSLDGSKLTGTVTANAIVPGTYTIDINGNATTATSAGTATNANNISTFTTGSFPNTDYYIGFFPTVSNSYQQPVVTAALSFNPNTDILTTTSTITKHYYGGTLANPQAIGLNGGNIGLLTSSTVPDTNNGLGYYGSSVSKSWGVALPNVDGPVLFGNTSGVLGIAAGNVASLQWTATEITLFGEGAGPLTGTGVALQFAAILAQGNYIAFGGNGKNIGVDLSDDLFISTNLNYNSTTNGYFYVATTVAATLILTSGGDLKFDTAPSGTGGSPATTTTQFSITNTGTLNLRTGTNGYRGSVTLVAGTATVNTTTAVTGCYIGLSNTDAIGTAGFYTISITNGVSFTVTSSNPLDTSILQWFIIG